MCHPALKQALVFAQRLKDLALLRRVRDRIDREYARPLDVEALARGANMAAGQLSAQFRQAYGASPHAYLTARRLERAAAITHRTDLGVDEVRAVVGWSTPGSFGPRFAEVVGVPPGQCRREVVGGPASAHLATSTPVRNREAPVLEPQLA